MRQWKPGKSEFRGLTPTVPGVVVLKELGDDGEWHSSEVDGNLIDLMTVSMGIYSGLLNVTGHSRASFLRVGIVLPEYDATPVYH